VQEYDNIYTSNVKINTDRWGNKGYKCYVS